MSDGWDGMDGMGLSYTAVTPRASLMSDANNGKLLTEIYTKPMNDNGPHVGLLSIEQIKDVKSKLKYCKRCSKMFVGQTTRTFTYTS